jgi:hypothetical protein
VLVDAQLRQESSNERGRAEARGVGVAMVAKFQLGDGSADGAGDPPSLVGDEIQDEKPSEKEEAQRTRTGVRLLTSIGFLATATGFVTDLSLSDVAVVVGGLLSVGVVTAGGATLKIILSRSAVSAKVEELHEIREEISIQNHGKADDATVQQLYEVIDARIGELGRSLGRAGWRQGTVFAVFGFAVAILVVVFGRWIPTIK